MPTPTTSHLPVQERRNDRTEAWSHPITGGVSLVRITRDAQGFGIIRQVAVIPAGTASDQPQFDDCQFGNL